MSDDAKRPIGADKILLGILALVVVGALLFLGSQRQTALRNSQIGLDGLRIWLSSEGVETQTFTGGWPLLTEEVGLLIVPLHDTQLDTRRIRPTTSDELLMQQDEYDLQQRYVIEKARDVPVLVVLPKWRSGLRLTGLAHPVLLNNESRLQALGDGLTKGDRFNIIETQQPFSSFDYQADDGSNLTATLYAAQLFTAPGCRALVGDSSTGMILGDCKLQGGGNAERIYVLSDPDLINNHGLALGENAFIMRDLLPSLASGGRVVVDYSTTNWLTSYASRSERERSWDDLLRFFEPPFLMIWLGAALTLALVLWHGGLRFGPVARTHRTGSVAKNLAIAARARLMLLSGHPGAMVNDYMRARLAAAATALFGHAHGRKMATPEAFLAYTRRRHPDRAGPLLDAINTITSLPSGTSTRHAMSAIDDLDRVLEQITHDT